MSADLQSLPKAELHVHLEATIGPDSVAELADRYGVRAPDTGPFADLTEFVAAYEQARVLVGSLDDLNRLAREFGARQRAAGVVWSEVHFFPRTYAGRLGHPDGLVEAVLDGLWSGAGRDHAGLVIGINRGLSVEAAEDALDTALRWAGSGVIALGLAGDEANHSGSQFKWVIGRATAHGLPSVPHAGEGAGARSVREAVDHLAPSRICHGVRAIEDDDLVAELAEKRICLDLAPTSNVKLGVVPDLAGHPLPNLMRRGVPVTLNSDIPLFIGHGLLEEYELCAQAWGLTMDEITGIAETSIRHSFCPDDVRDLAVKNLEAWRADTPA
jgi:adenosine deaminase